MTGGFSSRHDGEGQEGSGAGAGHAHSVSAAGGAGNLHNHSHREPECDRLHLWSYCKFSFICLLVVPVMIYSDSEMTDSQLKKKRKHSKI